MEGNSLYFVECKESEVLDIIEVLSTKKWVNADTIVFKVRHVIVVGSDKVPEIKGFDRVEFSMGLKQPLLEWGECSDCGMLLNG